MIKVMAETEATRPQRGHLSIAVVSKGPTDN